MRRKNKSIQDGIFRLDFYTIKLNLQKIPSLRYKKFVGLGNKFGELFY